MKGWAPGPRIEFDEGPHTYRVDGRPVPSVTQLLDHLNDWSHVPAIDLECARALGRDVHHACNLLARGSLDFRSLDSTVRPYVDAAAKFLEESPAIVIGAELRVASTVLGVAGTMDLLMHRDDVIYYVDWKTSAAVPSTVGPQLAAYEVLYNCFTNPHFTLSSRRRKAKRLCVRLGMGTYRVDVLDDFRKDWATFASCLTVWKHRERKYG